MEDGMEIIKIVRPLIFSAAARMMKSFSGGMDAFRLVGQRGR